jgi:ethanolamine utilization protein EutP (predicted NTPase)
MPLGETGLITLARLLTNNRRIVKFKAVNICNYHEHHHMYKYLTHTAQEVRIVNAYVTALTNNTSLTSFGVNIYQFSTLSIKRMLEVLCNTRNNVMDLDIPISRLLSMDDAARILRLLLHNNMLQVHHHLD